MKDLQAPNAVKPPKSSPRVLEASGAATPVVQYPLLANGVKGILPESITRLYPKALFAPSQSWFPVGPRSTIKFAWSGIEIQDHGSIRRGCVVGREGGIQKRPVHNVASGVQCNGAAVVDGARCPCERVDRVRLNVDRCQNRRCGRRCDA